MFLLRTFGALELTTEHGEPVAGAAAQRKPLLILALAALIPGGIPRERLLRALWPGVDRARARGTLKQHLYALRRATGHPNIVAGAPRLRVAADAVRVDALEFADHVEHGRLADAAALLRGDLFEDLRAPAGELLVDVVREIRESYTGRIAMVQRAIAVRDEQLAVAPLSVRGPPVGAERELAAAARRFVRGLITVPEHRVAAYHRAIAAIHDLLEALGEAERAGVPGTRIRELLAETEPIWHRCDLVRQMIASPAGQPGECDTLAWLVAGPVRTRDPVGHAIETHLLDAGLARVLKTRREWELRELIRSIGADPGHAVRVLLLAPCGARDLAAIGPLLQRHASLVAVCDGDEVAVNLARHRLASLGDRLTALTADAFTAIDRLSQLGPFDLILAGALLDQLTGRPGTWITERLLQMLAPRGTLCLSSMAAGAAFGPWLRHVVGWAMTERDQDDIILLAGDAAGECTMTWDRDSAGHGWFVAMQREHPLEPRFSPTSRGASARQAAIPLT